MMQIAEVYPHEVDGEVVYEYCSHCLEEGTPKFPLPHRHLMPFEPPSCNQCNHRLVNVITVNGLQQYQCVKWECSNKEYYDMYGELIRPNRKKNRIG